MDPAFTYLNRSLFATLARGVLVRGSGLDVVYAQLLLVFLAAAELQERKLHMDLGLIQIAWPSLDYS